MASRENKIVLQAHALRAAHAKTALMHGSARTMRESKNLLTAVWAGLGLTLLLLIVLMAITLLLGSPQKRALTPSERPDTAVSSVQNAHTVDSPLWVFSG